MEEVGKRSYASNTYPTSKFSEKKEEEEEEQTGRNENMKETN